MASPSVFKIISHASEWVVRLLKSKIGVEKRDEDDMVCPCEAEVRCTKVLQVVSDDRGKAPKDTWTCIVLEVWLKLVMLSHIHFQVFSEILAWSFLR